MIRLCDDRYLETIWSIANEAAQAFPLHCADRQRNLDECQIAIAPADGGDTTKAITVPVPASSGYPPPTSQ
jgi:hypothetical protein